MQNKVEREEKDLPWTKDDQSQVWTRDEAACFSAGTPSTLVQTVWGTNNNQPNLKNTLNNSCNEIRFEKVHLKQILEDVAMVHLSI